MFEIHTDDPARLKRIAVFGGGGLLVGLTIIVFNLVGPLFMGGGYGWSNLVFGVVGVVIAMLASRPTYYAMEKLDGS